jgi:hypothetical protein
VHKEEFAVCSIRTLDKGEAYSKDTNPSSRQRGCYIRTVAAKVELQKKILLS